ncbi:hypothetical protein KIH27_14840 [Mycobacterium sp. M1]|uniref:PPE family domain-containing protein n=1 Tax=Mycolicibacter acidiphilus TaxID=2835306 RepID=A0ABS5RLJ4_9MYCO|nr:hypothetical protein [Mycolicibacter acidiphilus]MBS9534867.1 hypothetical protein [Mycolicibacter acidiphilus]
MTLPSLSEVENASWEYLTTCAANWRSLANKWEQAFTEVRNQSMHPGGTEWTGDAADAAQARTDSDMMWVRNPTEQLRDAAGIAERGREQQEACRRTLVSTVEDVRNAGFNVAEDYHVTPTDPDYSSSEALMAQMNTAAEHEEFIKYQVARLVEGENDLSRQLDTATQGLDNFAFPAEEGDGGAGAAGMPRTATLVDDVTRNPTINNDASTPVMEPQSNDEQKKDDLEATIPNTGINIGGDGKHHKPTLNGEPNPLDAGFDARPLPTGTAQGPDGQLLAFYSMPPYHIPPGSDVPNESYVTPNSAIVDLKNPSKVIGKAPVAQASGVYDPATNTMYVVGNPGDGHGDVRELWQSAPVDPNNPNSWASNWHKVGDVLAGNRENQLIKMEGGGYMLTGATDFGPVTAVAASSPEGLVGNPNVITVVNSDGPKGVPGVYGPTVVADHFDPATGTDTITLRTSQFAPPDAPLGPDGKQIYDPRTFTSTFTVSQPPPAPIAPPR